jgi:hypothetical protein
MSKQFVVTGAVTVAVATLATACGGSSKSGAPATTASTPSTPISTQSAPSFAPAKNCRQLLALAARVRQSIQPTRPQGTVDVEREAALVQALANAAPAAIKGDLQTFANAFSRYAHAYKTSGIKPGQQPTSAQIAKVAAAAKSLGTPKVARAIAHLAAWGKKNCGG